MKIAYLSVFYPYRGGISQFNAALYRALEKKHDVKAYTFKRQYPDFLFPGKTQFVEPGDTADAIPAERTLDSINPASWRKTVNMINEISPDMLITQTWMPFFGPSLGWVAGHFKKKIPTVSIIANMKPHEPNPGDVILSKFFLKRSHGFIVMAEEVKNDMLELKPDAEYFYHPHPNYEHFGEKVEKAVARDKLNLPMDKNIVLFFGLIRDYKGLDILIKAFKDMPDDHFLLVAGEVYGDDKRYTDLLKENLPENNYRFVNRYISDDEVPLYFSAADLCALPYRTATQSGIVGIAYHFGLPVVSTDTGGLREVIEPYGTGIVVDHADEELIRNAIKTYFKEGLQKEFSQNVDKFSRKYTWDSMADGIVDFALKFK